ncbi:MAG: glycosyltransferase, partial [Actinomycetota bacterium]
FDNPERVQSAGLNLLAQVAASDILIRADAHTTYATSYISASVASLRDSGADAVGGPLVPEGNTPFGQAVARAFRSRLGIGPAAFHHAEAPVEADTVYLGAMKTKTFLENGGMRRLPSRVAEDADFYYRIRQRGGRVIVDPAIRTVYTPRETPSALWFQFYQYGLGKADMFYINGEFPSWRPLAPLALVLGLVAGVIALIAGFPWLLLAVGGLWLAALLVASRARPLDLAAVAIMHLSYGVGLLRGLLRRPATVRSSVGDLAGN